jgi:hypothetical protein
MMRLLNWIVGVVTFWLKFFIFLGVFILLTIYGVIHAAIFGGPIMPDDAWFFAKILFLILLPVVLAIACKSRAPFFVSFVFCVILAANSSWGTYAHAPQFRPATFYTVEGGKLVIPEDKRDELLRDCGHITNEGLKDSCQTVVYCQSWDALAYERGNCGELLAKKSSPALLDIALIERDAYEYGQR